MIPPNFFMQDRLATKTLEKDNQGIFSGKLRFGHSLSCQALKKQNGNFILGLKLI